MSDRTATIFATYSDRLDGQDDLRWDVAHVHPIDRQWNGEAAPRELATSARLLRTADQLFVNFLAGYTELDVNKTFDSPREHVHFGNATFAKSLCGLRRSLKKQSIKSSK
jgi:hypothetical protein